MKDSSSSKNLKATIIGILIGSCIGYGAAWVILPSLQRQTDRYSSKQSKDISIATTSTNPLPSSHTGKGPSQLKAVLSKSTDREALHWLRGQTEHYSAEQFAAALDDVVAQGFGRHKELFAELCETWGFRDPKAALLYAEKMPPHIRKAAYMQILKGWIQADAAAATQWVQTAIKTGEHPYLKAMAIRAIATSSPAEAFALAQEEDSQHSPDIHYFFSGLAETNPREAIQFLSQVKDKQQLQQAARSIAITWGQTDPEAALSWARELPKGEMRDGAMQSLITQLGSSDPLQAAQMAWEEHQAAGGGRNTTDALFSLLSSWGRSNPDEAQKWLAQLPEGEFRKNGEQTLAQQWARTKPLDYLNHALQEGTPNQDDQNMMHNAFSQLLQKDSKSAHEWITRNKAELTPEALQTLVSSATYNNPQEAIALLPLLPEGNQTRDIYLQAARMWIDKNPQESRDYYATLPAGPKRDLFLKGMVSGLAQKEVPLAIAEIEKTPAGPLRDELARSLGQSAISPAQAVDWLSSQAQSAARDSALSSPLSNWARKDAAAAGEWLAKAPAGPFKDQSVSSFSSQIVGKDAALAVQWAASIQDEKIRLRTFSNVAQQWYRTDEAAARKWIQDSPLPEKDKARYLKTKK